MTRVALVAAAVAALAPTAQAPALSGTTLADRKPGSGTFAC
jgi:hypothetical protein